MSRNRLTQIMNQIDPALVEECAGYCPPSERNGMNKHHSRRLAVILLAACLVVVVAAVLAVPQFRGSDNDTTPPQLTGTPFHQVDTLAALSDAVGFPVTEVSKLPFDPVSTTYTAYDEGLAEITYTGSVGQTATYRQSLGTADNSGDYTLYEDTQVIPENNATLKGQDQRYTLALWTDGTYTYSLRLSSALSADAWQALLDGPAP